MTLEQFVFDLPLYTLIAEKDGYDTIAELLRSASYNISIDGYNALKKKESSFVLKKGIGDIYESRSPYRYSYHKDLTLEKSTCVIIFVCKRYGDEISILVRNNPSDKKIMKVGQYPSIADIHIGQVKQYDKVLEKAYLKEYTKAIGLAANGVGVGSFVYLRRVFEKLVDDAFKIASKESRVEKTIYQKSRMEERLKLLKGYLPPFIVDNSQIYGILSKGLHELDEDECLAYFTCMKSSIEMILDEQIEILAKKQKEDSVKKAILEISSKLKS